MLILVPVSSCLFHCFAFKVYTVEFFSQPLKRQFVRKSLERRFSHWLRFGPDCLQKTQFLEGKSVVLLLDPLHQFRKYLGSLV